jgi:endoglucanase
MLDDATYARVARILVEAIRAESPDRLIIADGLLWGRVPVPALAELGVGQSTRGYDPHQLSHWKAGWVEGSDSWPEPTWPMPLQPGEREGADGRAESFRRMYPENPIVQRMAGSEILASDWDRERLRRQLVEPWKELEAMGVGVHVGEFGAFRHTPHGVTLRWMRDLLGLWKEAGWGWALWNLRGPFGIVDSERTDVKYEDFRGHKLDRAMLELLREH